MMQRKIRRILEFALVAFIMILSVTIFLMRERIGQVSNAGYLGVFFLCFLSNSTVLLPAPSLMIAASCALIMNPFWVALSAAAGSTLGEFVGYAFGTVTQDLSPRFQALLDKLEGRVPNQTVLVFLLAVLPLPLFDVIGIYSGGTKMNLVRFAGACFLGKLIKLLVYTRIYDILEWACSII